MNLYVNSQTDNATLDAYARDVATFKEERRGGTFDSRFNIVRKRFERAQFHA